ncbi:MAG: hypothetical protein FWC06_05445 [Treponema sp.]|nr:hypothetical protein [Treponema sp.]
MRGTVFFGLLIIVFIFSFISCGGDDNLIDKTGTFNATIFSLSIADYEKLFVDKPTGFKILSGDQGYLFSKVSLAKLENSYSVMDDGFGISWDQVEDAVQTKLVGAGIITLENKDTLMNTLGKNSYVVGVIPIDNDRIGIAAAYKY